MTRLDFLKLVFFAFYTWAFLKKPSKKEPQIYGTIQHRYSYDTVINVKGKHKTISSYGGGSLKYKGSYDPIPLSEFDYKEIRKQVIQEIYQRRKSFYSPIVEIRINSLSITFHESCLTSKSASLH